MHKVAVAKVGTKRRTRRRHRTAAVKRQCTHTHHITRNRWSFALCLVYSIPLPAIFCLFLLLHFVLNIVLVPLVGHVHLKDVSLKLISFSSLLFSHSNALPLVSALAEFDHWWFTSYSSVVSFIVSQFIFLISNANRFLHILLYV